MVLCSTDEVRGEITTILTDTEIATIVARASRSVASRTGGSPDASDNDDLNLACIHLSAAAVLRKMRTNGELPASTKQGNAQQNNTIDQDIQDHETQAATYIKKYRCAGYSVVYGRSGPGTVNNEG